MGGADAGAAREFEYTARDFERVRALIYRVAGISLNESKQDLVYSRLARRLRALGVARFRDYLDALEADSGAEEWQGFVNALTTNLTSFFREEHHFPMLARHMKETRRRPYVVWCGAASTGEEPYSLAMTAVEAFGSFDAPVRIIATDVDTNVLESCQRGVYAMERMEKMSPERLRRFFQRGSGANAGYARVRDELRRLLVFRPLNLLDESWPIRGPVDAVFLRNVLIYFDRPTQARVVEKVAPLLNDGGLLFVGHSETLAHCSRIVRLVGRTVYAPAGRAGAAPVRPRARSAA